MRKYSIILLLVFVLMSMPNLAVADNAGYYLPDSTGIELQWEYTETAPKRPYPHLLNSDNYSVKWKIDNPLMHGLVQDQHGILYTSDSDDFVRAVYPNGVEKWSIRLDMGLELSVIDLIMGQDGTLYAYSSDIIADIESGRGLTTIYALSADGKIQWKEQSTSIYSRFNDHFGGDRSGNFVYFTEQGLVSRNAEGKLNWVKEDLTTSTPNDHSINAHRTKVFVDSKGNIYVDTEKRQIISLDSGGNVRWRSQPQTYLDAFNVFHPFFSKAGLLYMLTEDGLHALDADSGQNVKVTRQADLADIRSSGIPTDGQGGYYIQIRGTVHKIDSQGRLIWTYAERETEKYGVGSLDPLATDDKGNVYFPTGVGNIIGLNSAGQEIFVFLRNGFWYKITEMVIGKNGNIYSMNHDIGLVAFGAKGVQVYSDNLFLPMSVAPVNDKGTVLVPFRSLFEGFGLDVEWDPGQNKVTGSKEGLVLELTIGSNTAYVNGQPKTLTKAPGIMNGSTYVPLRFVGEALGKKVSWDGKGSFVNIESA